MTLTLGPEESMDRYTTSSGFRSALSGIFRLVLTKVSSYILDLC
jgi:hypothetical protein